MVTFEGVNLDWWKVRSFKFSGDKPEEIRSKNEKGVSEALIKSITRNYDLSLQSLTLQERDALYTALYNKYLEGKNIKVDVSQKGFHEYIGLKSEKEFEFSLTDINTTGKNNRYDFSIKLKEVIL